MKSPVVYLIVLIVITSCTSSPLNRRQVILYSDAQMEQQGTQAYQQMRAEIPVSTDARELRYVECVARAVVDGLEEADRNRYQWEVTLFDQDQANAFALPGGKMGVYVGLLDIASNQHQLATVLAHEVGHVLANHSNERASQSALRNVGLAAAQVFGVSETTVSALDTASQLGLFLPFNRTQESEADNLGLFLMARAGFDPRESVELWRNMAAEASRRPPELLSTHPSPDTRISGLQGNMGAALAMQESASGRGLNPDCGR